jgi:hypothetical protein
VIYVGSSRCNVYARIGEHVRRWGSLIKSFSLVPCEGEDALYDLESSLIAQHQPELNKAGRDGRAAVARPKGYFSAHAVRRRAKIKSG